VQDDRSSDWRAKPYAAFSIRRRHSGEIQDGVIVRRIAADSRKLDLGDNAGAKLNLQLLEAMGFDLGAIHAASEVQTPSIRSDLDARPLAARRC
jgi:hypothetical protein